MLQKVSRSFAVITLSACAAMGQADKPPAAVVAGIPVNYDEARVGSYTLPDPLLLANGKPVRDAKTWNEKRRAEIVRLFEENQYGRSPGRPAAMSFDVFDKGTPAFDGKGDPPPGDDLLLGGQGRAEDGPADLSAGQRHQAGAAAAESELLGQFQHGQRSRRQSGRSLGPGQEEDSRRPGDEFRQGQRDAPAGRRASASPRSTTATSIPISWAACRTACGRSI